jgi:hypothetical protein
VIWHIFRKDLRLMWPFVAGLLLVAALDSWLDVVAGTLLVPGLISIVLQLLPVVEMLGIAVVIVMVVQQDNLLGDRHDWLLRPIDTDQVLAAKLLFAGLAVHGPLVLIDALETVSIGLSIQQGLIAALSHQSVLFCLFTTPALIMGATTRNLVGALGFSVALIIIYALCLVTASNLGINPFLSPVQSGYSWLVAWTTGLIYVALMIVLARFQYRQRRETSSRIVGVTVTTAAFVLLGLFPWGAALQAQRWVDGTAKGEEAISLGFSPDLLLQANPVAQSTAMRRPSEASGGVLAPRTRGRDLNILDLVSGIHVVTLPVQIAGLPVGDVMVSDRGIFRIESPSGRVLFKTDGPICARVDRGGVSGTSCTFAELRAHDSPNDHDAPGGTVLLPLPTSLYEQIKAQAVQVTLDFTLTWLQHRGPQFMHAVKDRRMMDGIGLCTTGIDHDADEIELRCMVAVRQPSCLGASLQDSRSGLRNPLLFGCGLDYAPFSANWIPPGLIRRAGADLPFLDPDGLAHYPVDTSRIDESQVVLDAYIPRAHFNRQLKIPAIRFSDWESPATRH